MLLASQPNCQWGILFLENYMTEEERKARRKAYRQTEKYKEIEKKYRQTDKSKETRKRYKQRYKQTEAYKESNKRYREKQTDEQKEKKKAYMKEYMKSESGKKSARRHRYSEKGQASLKRRRQSATWKAARQKYRDSEKGKEQESAYSGRNREKRRQLSNNSRDTVKQCCIEYLGGACAHCGIKDDCSAIYDFHHRDPSEKEFNVSSFCRSFEKLKSELDKCDLLCGNCHRKVHFKHNTTWPAKRKRKCIAYCGGACKSCGLQDSNIAPYVFHHRDPEKKEFVIGQSAKSILNLPRFYRNIMKSIELFFYENYLYFVKDILLVNWYNLLTGLLGMFPI